MRGLASLFGGKTEDEARLMEAVSEGVRFRATMMCGLSSVARMRGAFPSNAGSHDARHPRCPPRVREDTGHRCRRAFGNTFPRPGETCIRRCDAPFSKLRRTSSIKVRSSTTKRCASKIPASLAPMASAIRCWISSNSARVAISATRIARFPRGAHPRKWCEKGSLRHPASE